MGSKAYWFFLLITFTLFSRFVPAYAGNIQFSSIVIDASSGHVLHSEAADEPTYPASLTKMMTLYLLFEALDKKKISFKTRFRTSVHATVQAPSKLGLKVGETICVRDAMLALIVKSANDVAVTVAENLAGTEVAYAELMTRKAKALGMHNTTFKNASGLPHKHQKTTARDMAILGLSLYKKFPHYYAYFKTDSFCYRGFVHTSHNHLVKKFKGCDGIKTGFINASGFNLVSSAKRHGKRYIVAVLGSENRHQRDRISSALLELAFDQNNPPANQVWPSCNDTVYQYAAVDQAQQNILAADQLNELASKIDQSTDFDDHYDFFPEAPEAVKSLTNIVRIAHLTTREPSDNDDYESPDALNVKSGKMTKAIAEKLPRSTLNRPITSPEKTWGVQIGSYSHTNLANTACNDYRKILKMPATIKNSVSSMPSSKSTKLRLYRARLVGFNKKQAETVCKLLKKQGRPCMVVSPSLPTTIYTAMN